MSSSPSTSLSESPTGEYFRIKEIQSQPETNQRLLELGFGENSVVRTILNSSSRLICEVGNTRIGLHHRIARHIMVSPMEELAG